uniref:Uncharacterized protein n=1 Tax=Picea glauca TaxID=3330 RepID=A0A101LVL2_PICGL|nr:hypothetical protein ABT39_MTgene1963 [Picea glauca]
MKKRFDPSSSGYPPLFLMLRVDLLARKLELHLDPLLMLLYLDQV